MKSVTLATVKKRQVYGLGEMPIYLVLLALILSGCVATPHPLTTEEIDNRAETTLSTIFNDQEPVTAPITLYDAMARAIKYNLDYRLTLMEEALANKQLDVARFDLLPEVAANAGYTSRNNFSGAASRSLLSGQPSLEPSTSEERDIWRTDIGLMWNVLDFGVSYIRAKQFADNVLIADEKRRKVIQNIIQDVRAAYWRAVGAERLVEEMIVLIDRARSALNRSKAIGDQRLRPLRENLIYQRELLENIRILWDLVQQLDQAKKELAALMNLNPGQAYTLYEPDLKNVATPDFTIPVDTLEMMAMTHRPELREEDYQVRISSKDVHKAILQMLPGIEINFRYNYDTNDFLFNNSWRAVSTRVSWNIMNLLSGPASIRFAKTQIQVDEMRRQAVSMAVLTQLHLSLQRFGLVKKAYTVSRDLSDVYDQIHEQMRAAETAGRADELTVIRSSTNALLATIRWRQAYAELENAKGRVYHSVGIDLIPETVGALDVATLSQAMEVSLSQWESEFTGRTSPVPDEDVKEEAPKIGALMLPDIDWVPDSETGE